MYIYIYTYIYILCEIWGIPILTDTHLAMSLTKNNYFETSAGHSGYSTMGTDSN